ncbi:arsenite methyltransferase [Nakamurella flava]|uniref:Arsenite methyltransferase n=1 Tax=Nakamurella flava TaxID=2576308 RepID=A0A4U6QE02_9ACTN|nr:arsenite methyltransferase [Nakamurella flava]TKV58271.1 arsenite methyltransferase [Nakamurella flava]
MGTQVRRADADAGRERVRSRYAAAAMAVTGPSDGSTSGACCSGRTRSTAALDPAEVDRFGAGLYEPGVVDVLPVDAVAASLGCGNPLAVADLAPGEIVLDLGSGGGIDVLLSARRVGPTGHVYGLDMTDEMLDLARANAAAAGETRVEFLKGQIEAIPLSDAAVDVVISNCVVNLSADKPAVLAETFRVLRPGGRIGISDVVAEDHLTAADRAERGSDVGCIAGALSRSEYLDELRSAGFSDVDVTFTHPVADGLHGAIVSARKPA